MLDKKHGRQYFSCVYPEIEQDDQQTGTRLLLWSQAGSKERI